MMTTTNIIRPDLYYDLKLNDGDDDDDDENNDDDIISSSISNRSPLIFRCVVSILFVIIYCKQMQK